MPTEYRAARWMIAGLITFNAMLVMVFLSWIAVTRLGVLESTSAGALTVLAARATFICHARAFSLYRQA